jgi:hypothetical protein
MTKKGVRILRKIEQEVVLYDTIIKTCLIQRLTEHEITALFAKHDIEMGHTKWFKLKAEYNKGTNARFLNIAKSEWADEHILIIDKFKAIENKYWELFNESGEIMERSRILDSIRATQEQMTLFYNETPLIQKMKDTLEAKLEELNKKGRVK